jgi:hypothetical protein
MNVAPSWVRTSSLAAALVVLSPAMGTIAAAKAAKPHASAPHVSAPHVSAPHASAPRAAMSRQIVGVPHRGYPRGYHNYNRGYNHNAMANQNNGQVISHLNSALATLAKSDHDYQGHRVRAMNHIGTAIRHLEPAAVRRNMPNPASSFKATSNGAGAGKNPMPQAASDQHLHNALQSLNGVGTQLATFGTSQNHARALGSVRNAIQELNTALNIR